MPYRFFSKLFLLFSKVFLLCILLFSSFAVLYSPPAAAQDNWIRQVVVRIINDGPQPTVLMGREVQYSDRSEWVDDLWIVYPEQGEVEQVDSRASQQTMRDLNACLYPPSGKSPEQLNCHYMFIGPPRF
ncbi:MAG: hypothetical protein AB1589_41685 [Cyanobacteriota bacterium]